jgi:hypothetical protein
MNDTIMKKVVPCFLLMRWVVLNLAAQNEKNIWIVPRIETAKYNKKYQSQ